MPTPTWQDFADLAIKRLAASGAEYRIVVDFAKPRSFRATQNIGNSGVPGSPHYKDT